MTKENQPIAFDWETIRKMLPHRYPFLLVDRILTVDRSEVKKGDFLSVGCKVHGMKCITGNEPFFQGHFPKRSVVPGVLLLEMMAQCSIFAIPTEYYDEQGRLPVMYLSKVEKCRFRSFVKPGDILDIHCHLTKIKGRFASFNAHMIERQSGDRLCETSFLGYFDLDKTF